MYNTNMINRFGYEQLALDSRADLEKSAKQNKWVKRVMQGLGCGAVVPGATMLLTGAVWLAADKLDTEAHLYESTVELIEDCVVAGGLLTASGVTMLYGAHEAERRERVRTEVISRLSSGEGVQLDLLNHQSVQG